MSLAFNPTEEQLSEMTIIFNYAVPVCTSCGKLLTWEEFVDAYYIGESNVMECTECFCESINIVCPC